MDRYFGVFDSDLRASPPPRMFSYGVPPPGDGRSELCEPLSCNHEEADTRLILHANNAKQIKPGLHIVIMVVSTVASMFLTLFQAVSMHVNTLITTSQA